MLIRSMFGETVKRSATKYEEEWEGSVRRRTGRLQESGLADLALDVLCLLVDLEL